MSFDHIPTNRSSRIRRRFVAGLAVVATLVATVAVLALPSQVDSAQAVPVGSEFPATWTVSGNIATGTTPSGVVVTATITAPATFSSPASGSLINTGAKPSYLPTTTTQALRINIQNCSNTAASGCGSITYSFSKPVTTPVFYTADVGGQSGGATIGTFHSHPVTLTSGGTLSTDSAGSMSSFTSITNGGVRWGYTNPNSPVGTAGSISCGVAAFACAALDVATPTQFVSSVTFGFGYAGTNTNLDTFTQMLGITPINPALTLTKSASPTTITAAGQQVTYSFAVTNTGNAPLANVGISETAFSGTGTLGTAACAATTLAVGASTTCTAPYTPTQADVDAGSITNTAIATATVPASGGTASSAPSSAVVTATPAPAITVVKSASPSGPSSFTVGQVITYTFLVTNTGNVTLTNPSVTETGFSGSGTISPATCPAGALAPSAQISCTATYTLTQADVNGGSVSNTATATGTPPTGAPPVSPPSTATIPVASNPSLTLAKSATPTTITAAGQTVTYSFAIKNTGNVTLTNVGANETAFSGTGTALVIACPAGAASLSPGASVTCTATYTATQADVDAGQVTNTATAAGTPPTGPAVVSPPSSATVTATAAPAITVVKSATPSGAAAYAVGQVISYSFLVTNTGNVTLANVGVNETAFTGSGALSATSCPAGAVSLAPDAQVTCTATYTLSQADIDRGTTTNTATATGTPPTGAPPVSPPSTVTIQATPSPAITVVKTADRPSITAPGQTIIYSFLATNTGNVTLTNVTVTDTAFTGTGAAPVVTCPGGAASLAPGASVTCTASYVTTQADVDAAGVTNTATATGTPPAGAPPVSPPSSVTVPATANPGITLVKSATPTTIAAAGDPVSYSFLVTNTGNVTLSNVGVNETAFSGSGTALSITCPAGAASLAPNASVTCVAGYTATQADVDAGSVTNTATATGTTPTGAPVTSDPSSAVVTATPAPAISMVKSADPSDAAHFTLGQLITYSFVVTNTGNVTLTGVTVDEGGFTGSGALSAVICPAGAASLAPGAQVTCTATYTITQADVDGGSVTNDATATGTPPSGPPPVSPPSTVTIPSDPAPAITVVKSASTAAVSAPGQTLTYSFLVTNTGNVTLANVAVDEGAFTGSGTLSPVTCPAGAASLAPGAQLTCTATYAVTQADVDAGSITNAATATGTPPSGPAPVSPPSTVTVTASAAPSLSLVKTATPTTVSEAGEQVSYSFAVTNTGNVTLTGVAVGETSFSGTGTVPVITCPAGAASLAPAATVTCTATYTATQADADAGQIANTATATGTPPTGASVTSDPSSALVTIQAAPGITVVKSVSPSDAAHFTVGQSLTYSFVVTNTGNVTLTDVTVDEGSFTGTGALSAVACPGSPLAPGAQATCTATYTITQADVDAGSVTNDATASGTPPSGPPPVSPRSAVTIPSDPAPAITVRKTADRTMISAPGQVVTYSFLVTNTGNVTLTNATVQEGSFSGAGSLSPVTCPSAAASLAPGAQATCTATYTVLAADLSNATLTNTATVTATPPSGTPVGSPPSTARVAIPHGAAVNTGGQVIAPAASVVALWLCLIAAGVMSALAAWLVAWRRRRIRS